MALTKLIGADNNTAAGMNALLYPTKGSSNTGVKVNALGSNTTGNSNIALGDLAGINLTIAATMST